VPGPWKDDLILGLDSFAIGTLVERSPRFTFLSHLPRMSDFGQPRMKNGPALAGHGAEAVRDAIASSIVTLPKQPRRSLTWDQGAERAQHVQLRIQTGPLSPSATHTVHGSGGTDLSRYSAEELEAVAATLNGRPARNSRLETFG
jgi:IS30 family transposase